MTWLSAIPTPPVTNLSCLAAALFIPVGVAIIHIAVMAVTLPQLLFALIIGLIVAYHLPSPGKETLIPIGFALGILWWHMELSIAMIDVETDLFMALNVDLAYRIPCLGPVLLKLTGTTQQFIAPHLWIVGIWFFAIVLMVMPPVFLTILVGAFIRYLGIALGSDAFLGYLCSNGTLPLVSALLSTGVEPEILSAVMDFLLS